MDQLRNILEVLDRHARDYLQSRERNLQARKDDLREELARGNLDPISLADLVRDQERLEGYRQAVREILEPLLKAVNP